MLGVGLDNMDGYAIPRQIGHIWVGPLKPPTAWMETWKQKHPDWTYTLYDNRTIENFPFRTRKLIDRYMTLKLYAGAADLMRYELLFRYGGFLAEADSICLRPIDELFVRPCAHTVYENEFIRGKLVSPILACPPNDPFVGALIERLALIEPAALGTPWVTTGNLFVARMIEELDPDIVILPSHTFIPVHFEGVAYSGSEKIYAVQYFGSTRDAYPGMKPAKSSLVRKVRSWLYRRKRRHELKDIAASDMKRVATAFKTANDRYIFQAEEEMRKGNRISGDQAKG
jgi:hypothetical protein